MKEVKYLIIGGGITGLTCATYASDNYLVIEKENEVGGYCRPITKKRLYLGLCGTFFSF